MLAADDEEDEDDDDDDKVETELNSEYLVADWGCCCCDCCGRCAGGGGGGDGSGNVGDESGGRVATVTAAWPFAHALAFTFAFAFTAPRSARCGRNSCEYSSSGLCGTIG